MFTFRQRKKEVLTFRRFRRANWALFSCLHREVRIGVLSIAMLSTAAPCLKAKTPTAVCLIPDDTPTETSDTTLLSEADVTTSHVLLGLDIPARQVTTLTRTELAAAGVASINDVLKTAENIDVRQRGGFGIQSDISINGGTFDQIAIFINGIPYNNPQTGHNAADFPFNLVDIERIEVLEGAAARLFGSQAFSGAINVVTKKKEEHDKTALLALEGGSYGYMNAHGRAAIGNVGATQGFHTSISGIFQRSDGAVDNGDFEGGKLFWQGRYTTSNVRMQAQAGLTANDFGANTFYSPANNRQWEATRRYSAAMSLQTEGRIHLNTQLSWNRCTDHYQWKRDTPVGENFNRSDVFDIGMGMWVKTPLGRTAIGGEVRHERILSRNLGKLLPENQWIDIPGQNGLQYNRKDERTNVSYHLEHIATWRRITVSAGALLQYNSALKQRFGIYPGIDLSYRSKDRHWRLFASWNKSLRLPTFTDLWYKSPSQEGNTDLQPEQNSAFRLGTDYYGHSWQLHAKAFYNHGTDMIDWVMYSPTDVYHAANFSLDGYGVSLHLKLDLRELTGFRPLKELQLAYAYQYQHRRDDTPVFRSNYTMEYLRHKATASLDIEITKTIHARLNLRIQHRNGSYQVYENLVPTNRLEPYGTHAVLDTRLTWCPGKYEVFADFQNITAHRYADIAGVWQPGCLFRLRIQRCL